MEIKGERKVKDGYTAFVLNSDEPALMCNKVEINHQTPVLFVNVKSSEHCVFTFLLLLQNFNLFPYVFVGDLPEGVRGGPVWRLGEHEPGTVRCSQHTIWYKVWIRSQG